MAVGIVAVPGAGAQVQAPATEDASAQAGSVRWGPCTDPTLVSFGAQCGVVKVPVDYDRPNGDQVDLAVSRVRHTVPDAQFQGVMLVNPGGPGGSGLIYSVLGAFVPGGAGAELRLDRLRPARCRLERGRAELHPGLLRL